MLHCIRKEAKDFKEYRDCSQLSPSLHCRDSITRSLTNAEEEYVILGIEKGLYIDFQQKNLSPRLVDRISEAAFLLYERLPPRIDHHRNKNMHQEPFPIISLKKFHELKKKYYEFIAHYTKYELDIIFEHRRDREIVIEATQKNVLLSMYAMCFREDREFPMKKDYEYGISISSVMHFHKLMELPRTTEEKKERIALAIKENPLFIEFIDRKDEFYHFYLNIAQTIGIPEKDKFI